MMNAYHETVIPPSLIAAGNNGELDLALLENVGNSVLMWVRAARAWRVMVATAAMYDIDLVAGYGYRTLAEGEAIFRARYTTTPLEGRPRKRWRGQWWWQLPDTAEAAVPGETMHGWGCAVDIEGISYLATDAERARFDWLNAHADHFGFALEAMLVLEAWHWHYWPGDNPAPYELDHDEDDDMTDEQIEKLARLTAQYTAEAIFAHPISINDYSGGPAAATHPEAKTADYATIEGWRQDEIQMTRLGIGKLGS